MHEDVLGKIEQGQPGYNQAHILFDPPPLGADEIRYMVSYEWGLPGRLTHAAVMFEPESWSDRRILDRIILEVAKGQGRASPQTFLKSRIAYMIEDARSFPKASWASKHQTADLLEAFYLKGAGQTFLR